MFCTVVLHKCGLRQISRLAYYVNGVKSQVIAHGAYHTGSLENSFLKGMRRNPR